MSTECGSSTVGDVSDILSVSGDSVSSTQVLSSYENVSLIVKHTFAEFRCLDADVPKLRKTQSTPSLKLAHSSFEPLKTVEPTSPPTRRWAEISDEEQETVIGESAKSTSDGKKESARRSGRARQREKRRRQLRTPPRYEESLLR